MVPQWTRSGRDEAAHIVLWLWWFVASEDTSGACKNERGCFVFREVPGQGKLKMVPKKEKELKLGLTDMFTKVNLMIVNGMVKEL